MLRDIKYVQVSDVVKMPGMIVFRLFNEKMYKKTYKVRHSNAKTPASCCFTMTPAPEQEKIFRSKWMNKECALKYDSECGMYFIEI